VQWHCHRRRQLGDLRQHGDQQLRNHPNHHLNNEPGGPLRRQPQPRPQAAAAAAAAATTTTTGPITATPGAIPLGAPETGAGGASHSDDDAFLASPDWPS